MKENYSQNKDLLLAQAKLRLLELEHQPSKEKKIEGDFLLHKALDDLQNASQQIPLQESNLRDAINRTEANKSEDKHWEIKVDYYESQIEVIKQTYPLYEQVARERKQHFSELLRNNRWSREKELCSEDTLYWFKWWGWTSDPRTTEFGWALPFIPYEFQEDAIRWIEEHIFITKTSCLIEKSRDMGFSWLIASMFYKHWQHGDGTFQALVGSMTIDDVDTVGNPSSIFEKLRIQANLQPEGLLPIGWKRDIQYLKCVNPQTGASIIGESCNPRFGRSGRYKVILFDELSAVEQDTEALTASSQSSPCKIFNSTVRGMGNEFAQIAHSGTVEKKQYHWKQHPYKDEKWYKFQQLEMRDPTRVAQELDIDYTASTPNRVYPDYSELYHTVTKSEVMRALPTFKDPNTQKFRIPLGHSIAMGEDVSMMEGCAHILLWMVTLRKDTITEDGIDLTGSVLVYRELVMPPKSTPRKVHKRLLEVEGGLEKRMVYDRLISHEATTEQEIYADEYGLRFDRWDTNYSLGIGRIRDYLEIQHNGEPHPFRDFTRQDRWGDKAPSITGRPMIYLVVDDEQGNLQFEPATKRFSVTKPSDDGGLFRLRSEFPIYHFPTSELGKEVNKMRPKKIFDDGMDVLKGLANRCFAPIRDLTIGEKAVKSLPDGLSSDTIEQMPFPQQQVALIQQQIHVQEFIKREQNKFNSWREQTLNKALGR